MNNRSIIQKSLDYIEENLQTDITAAELADMAGFSLFHYYRLFQQATGLPVMQYILRRRLLHGIHAMAEGRGKTGAAMDFGFDTYAGFYRAFCREFGATPSDHIAAGRAKKPYRPDLTQEETMTVTHKKLARLLAHWDLSRETLSDIYSESTGTRHDTVCRVGSDHILKFTADPQKLKTQLEVAEGLQSLGLTVPVAVPTAEGAAYIQEEGLYFWLTRRIPGEAPAAHRFGDGDGRFVGEILGQLHLALAELDLPVAEEDPLSTLRDWALPRSADALNLPEAFCREYLTAFAALWPVLPRQIIHRDPSPGNILCSEGNWGILDFDLAQRNVRIYDPCYAATAILSETFTVNNEAWLDTLRDILSGYDSVAHLTEAEKRAIPHILLANQFVCVAWFAEQEKYADLFETNKKMTLWLMERFDRLQLV